MKPNILRLFGTRLLILTLVLVIIASALGLWMDSRGFLVNVLAGIVGIFLGFIIGLLVLDKYLEAIRNEQWAKVRGLTYESIANHLCDIAQEAGISFEFQPDYLLHQISEGRDHLSLDTVSAMKRFASELMTLSGALSPDNDFSDKAVDFYGEVKWDLNQISEILIPRVMSVLITRKLLML